MLLFTLAHVLRLHSKSLLVLLYFCVWITLSKICSKLEQSIKKSSELHGQWSFICMSISFSRVFICVSFTFRLIVFFIFKREGSIWSGGQDDG